MPHGISYFRFSASRRLALHPSARREARLAGYGDEGLVVIKPLLPFHILKIEYSRMKALIVVDAILDDRLIDLVSAMLIQNKLRNLASQ